MSGPTLEPSRGQASVELVAAVPALLLAALVALQLAIAGHTLWLTANAARVAARADAVGRDPRTAALGALPERLRDDARIEREDGSVRIGVRVPSILVPVRGPLVEAAAGLPDG